MDLIQKPSKKKSNKFFENYILKLLNSNFDGHNITADSRQQLNSVLCTISKIISTEARELTVFSKKKTISIDEVYSAISTILPKSIANEICVKGTLANTSYLLSRNDDKTTSKQVKAGICVPPSLVDKFLRGYGNSKIQVTASAPVYFAGAIEELIMYILKISVNTARSNKHVRLTVQDIEVSIRNDIELSSFFYKHNIMFLGGGITPYIHDALLVKRPRKRPNQPRTNKNHRFRPGTVSIRQIKKAQSSATHLTFPKSTFEQFIRDKIIQDIGDPESSVMIRKDVFPVIQFFIEQKVVDLLKNANFAAVHANRLKVIPEDIDFVNSILTGCVQNIIDEVTEEDEEVAEEDEEVAEEDEGVDEEDEEDEGVDEEDEEDEGVDEEDGENFHDAQQSI